MNDQEDPDGNAYHVCYDKLLDLHHQVLKQYKKIRNKNEYSYAMSHSTKFDKDVRQHMDSQCNKRSPVLDSAIQFLADRTSRMRQNNIEEVHARAKTQLSLYRQELMEQDNQEVYARARAHLSINNRHRQENKPDPSLVKHCFVRMQDNDKALSQFLSFYSGYFINQRIIFYCDADTNAEAISTYLSSFDIPNTTMLADISSKERRARLKSFRDRACVLVVSGENLSLEELSGIPVIAVFLYYPLRTKHSRKVPGGLFGYQHQVNAVCRFGHPGLCITIVQDETVQEALETVVCSYYVQYGTKLKQLVLGPDGSLAQTLAKYLL